MGHDEFVVGGLLALGAFHGVNPGMGWLFAVALGMQERRRSAVLAMLPLALGHGLAIAAAIAMAALIGAVVPLRALQWGFRLSCWLWGFRALPARTPALGRYAGGNEGSDRVVVPDGVRARRRADGVASRGSPQPVHTTPITQSRQRERGRVSLPPSSTASVTLP